MAAPSLGSFAVALPRSPPPQGYWLLNATVPRCCLEDARDLPADRDGLTRVDLLVKGGVLERIRPVPRKGQGQDAEGERRAERGSDADEDAASPSRKRAREGEEEQRGEEIAGAPSAGASVGVDSAGRVAGSCRSASGPVSAPSALLSSGSIPAIDLRGKMILPTFADLHTHVDKSHTADRSRNPTGALGGADASTAADGLFWVPEELERRMHFALECAYAHGTSAVRTHLINMTPRQVELTWPAFDRVRRAWKGKVELQGVSLVTLSFFRDAEASRRLADVVAEHGGLLGAAVCSTDRGGLEDEDWTTCARDRDRLLDRLFRLATERSLDVDLHVDENGNPESRGALDVARAIQRARNGWTEEGAGEEKSGARTVEGGGERVAVGSASAPRAQGKAEGKGSVENENENEHGEEVANGSCAAAVRGTASGARPGDGDADGGDAAVGNGTACAPVAAPAAKGGVPNGNGTSCAPVAAPAAKGGVPNGNGTACAPVAAAAARGGVPNGNGAAHGFADGTAPPSAGAPSPPPEVSPSSLSAAGPALAPSPPPRSAPLRFRGRVVLGHLCSLVTQTPEQVEETARALAAVGATVVSLPLVNAWTQDRWPREAVESERTHVQHKGGDGEEGLLAGNTSAAAAVVPHASPTNPSARLHAFGASTRTPRRRGLTDLHALARAGVPVAVASDNVRDQFHAYGDMDMLEVFAWAVRVGHLDRPFGAWPRAVGAVPANAMGLTRLCRLGEGLPADFVVFRARRFTELLARPQEDRVVVRNGAPLYLRPPHLEDLDDLGEGFRPEEW